MKIAFDSQIFTMQEYGGISRYISSLAAQLASIDGVEADIIAPFYINAHLEKLPKGIVSGIRIPKIPRMGTVFHRSGLWLARGAIARLAPQIVHETYYNGVPIAPKGARTVVTVYDMIHERFPFVFPQHDRTSERKRIATQRADHVICISESTRRDLLELFDLPEDKVSVVYLGFDSLLPTISETVQEKPYLLYVGHRSDYKNFEGFLRAYASSPWLRNNFNVVCFGSGIFSNAEKKLIDDLKLSDNQLRQMNGDDSDLANAYRGAALFVYPSLYEGFGIPPLEAMSLGCPVACSNNSSIPEVAGNAAEYFDPKDTESMRAAMECVLNSTARRVELIDAGFIRSAQFSWKRCAEETLAVYRSLV
ncbi:MAG: glycosyltransferase family 1 protein [Methylobacter sp.]|uniref:glycosyltransferase family 4 protein n=1 Tax=Methylobacter sp. TaxID=2051955 RepID=UPI002731175C|nr:glycosyltransferase family 1 protein [Methylobacter sp.]MDP1666465.1 glycosyltransferase family 1 protein [Methylobacter sp.]